MAKQLRSPERASAILDRAAKMKGYQPSILDRRLFDKQITTPGHAPSPFGNLNNIPHDRLAYHGVETVPLRSVHSDQNTISVKAVKDKLAKPASMATKDLPLVLHHNGKYHAIGGNHRLTAARALGHESIPVRVVRVAPLPAKPGAASASRVATAVGRPPAAKLPSKLPVNPKAALAIGVAAAAYAGYKYATAKSAPASGATQPKPQQLQAGNSSAASKTDNGRTDYQKVNGQAVQGTKAQIEAWQKRRKAG